MCDKAVSKNVFMLKYCHDRYKTQEICDIVVANFLPVLKFVLDCFVKNNMINKIVRHHNWYIKKTISKSLKYICL